MRKCIGTLNLIKRAKGITWAIIIGQEFSFAISLVYMLKLKNLYLNKRRYIISQYTLGRICTIGITNIYSLSNE